MFTIKEVSKLSGVSTHTLRYYDKINLLNPDKRDENNGYRYYGDGQLGVLDIIVQLREMKYSISFIKEYLDKLDYNYTLELIEKRISENRKEIEKLINIEENLQKYKKYVYDILDGHEILNQPFFEESNKMNGIWMEHGPDKVESRINFFSKINKLFGDEVSRFKNNIGLIVSMRNLEDGFFKPDKFVIFKEKEGYKDTYSLKEGKHACMYTQGAPVKDESIEFFLDWIEKNNCIVQGDLFIEFKSGPGVIKNEENFLQLIRVPVK
jgi:DNA-binding transcriptional MerR regulator